ncbi:hypothetical protein [Dactylosporangium sp. CS-033363]|uniref:hypothetical protein n=1 Tax=Dactylosporangium sp. CS-033363 TaxID=3239935 RepID=UPI003D8C0FD4
MRLTLYCEHALQPVHVLRARADAGVYDVEVPGEWWTRAVPLLKLTSVLLKPLVGVGLADLKLNLDDTQWKAVEEQVALANETLKLAADAAGQFTADEHTGGEEGQQPVFAEGATLRTLHAMLREQDITLADLRKVVRPDGRILWVHQQFVQIYDRGLPTIP